MATPATRPMRWLRLALVVVMCSTIGLLISPASPAAAGVKGCLGASCAGLDPMGRCDGDAYTVYSIGIVVAGGQSAGQLDLRYSPGCKSNWGRFTAASGPREVTLSLLGMPFPIGGRVTAWNPGGPSQQPVQANVLSFSLKGYSTWSKMVNGIGRACTGVEPFFGDTTSPSGNVQSQGWFWGPCA